MSDDVDLVGARTRPDSLVYAMSEYGKNCPTSVRYDSSRLEPSAGVGRRRTDPDGTSGPTGCFFTVGERLRVGVAAAALLAGNAQRLANAGRSSRIAGLAGSRARVGSVRMAAPAGSDGANDSAEGQAGLGNANPTWSSATSTDAAVTRMVAPAVRAVE